ncbi:putative RING-H2 finger protein ATL12 [Wolffia australiana]
MDSPSEDLQQEISFGLQPSLAIVMGLFFIVFAITFLLVVYTKYCHLLALPHDIQGENELQRLFNVSHPSRFSGLDKATIESLPSFRFSSLKGPREGLECSICLSSFEEAEILRLLPNCKHAFHTKCVDQWLQVHSCCPLCRCKVEVQDATVFKYSTSSRSLFHNKGVPEEPLDQGDESGIYVERVSRGPDTISAFSFRRSYNKNEESLFRKMNGGFHKHIHRIILSDIVFKNRWSDLHSSDLVSLTSEMLAEASSRRFSKGSEDEESSGVTRGRFLLDRYVGFSASKSMSIPPFTSRSMSDINFERFACGTSHGEGFGDKSDIMHRSRDEKLRSLWIPIALETIQLRRGREMMLEDEQIQQARPLIISHV